MSRRRRWLGVIAAGMVAAITLAAQPAVPLSEFEHALYEIPVANDDRILEALQMGMKTAGFPTDEVFRLIERLLIVAATPTEKESMLLTITTAIEDGLPIDPLLNKAFEGLARSVPIAMLNQLLGQRTRLLAESRDLFYAKGIFQASPGTRTSAGSTALPVLRFDALLSNFGDAIGDYLEGGGSPLEGHLIYETMEMRLKMLRGVSLEPDDVDLVLLRVEPGDLTRIALAALTG